MSDQQQTRKKVLCSDNMVIHKCLLVSTSVKLMIFSKYHIRSICDKKWKLFVDATNHSWSCSVLLGF